MLLIFVGVVNVADGVFVVNGVDDMNDVDAVDVTTLFTDVVPNKI